MAAFDAPERWVGRGRRKGLRVAWGNAFTAGLSFLFVPFGNGFIDLVRGDIMYPKLGIASPSYGQLQTPVGQAGYPGPGSAGGVCVTRVDPYYNQSSGRGTLMVGCYNPAAISGSFNVNASLINSASANTGALTLFDSTTTSQVQVGGGGSATTISGPLGASVTAVGWGSVQAGSFTGTTLTAWFTNQNYLGTGSPIAPASTSSSVTKTPIISQAQIGSDLGNSWGHRAYTFFAGWLGTVASPVVLTPAQMLAIAQFNGQIGRLPSCLAVRSGRVQL